MKKTIKESSVLFVLQDDAEGGTNVLLKKLYKECLLFGMQVAIFEHCKKSEKKWDLLLIPTSEIKNAKKIGNKVCFERILVWSMGFGALKESFFNANIDNFVTKFLVSWVAKTLVLNKSLVFTDIQGASVDLNSKKKITSCLLLPIAIEGFNPVIKSYPKEALSFVYVGRLSMDFKYLSLCRVFKDLNCYGNRINKFISLSVIGDGDAMTKLQEFSSKLNKLNVDFIGAVEHKKLGEIILNADPDVFIGMGTSVLEGAKLNFPSVLIMPMRTEDDFNHNEVYRWIYDSVGFSLGEFPFKVTGNSCFEKIQQSIRKSGLNKHASSSYDYASKFDLKKIFNRFICLQLPKKIGMKLNIILFFSLYFSRVKNKLKVIFSSL